MKKFNVLDRQLNIHQHYVLEASAGTGKTFSIQNMVVRLLVETSEKQPEPLLLNQILVVTFTRASTRDLRLRIRANIEQAIGYLNEWIANKDYPESTPDYLIALIELGIEAVYQAKKRLQHAIFGFDQAQIFTIHAFCSRMLRHYAIESDMSFHAKGGEESLPSSEIMGVIRDFFHTGIRPEAYSVGQLGIVLKADPEQRKLLRAVQSGYQFIETASFTELYLKFQKIMRQLKEGLGLNAEKMLEDFQAQYPSYRSYKAGVTKAEMLEKAKKFALLFDQENWSVIDFDFLLTEGLIWVDALDPQLLKNSAAIPQNLFSPHLRQELKNQLQPLVREAGSFSFLLCRLAKDCQELLKRYQNEEEKLSPDDLLKKMETALENPHFLNQIQQTYLAAIIDEFQDTDPLQWQIFKHLFVHSSWNGYLYLVGDPKQSIYSFRQADIYTYLSAAQTLGEECCFSLDTNYRSQPALVEALNTLFSIEHTSSLIPLPKQASHLPYQPVHYSEKTSSHQFADEKRAIHFFMADGKALKRPSLQELENKVFFPFIVNEIKNLNLSYHQFSILVRDRFQALRLAEFLDANKIPYLNQRGTSLAESEALTALIDVIRAVLHPYDLGIVKTALGGALIGCRHQELLSIDHLDSHLSLIRVLRQKLLNDGFSHFFQSFIDSCWQIDGMTVFQRILKRENGKEFYHDLQQIADLIIDHHNIEWNGPEGLIPFLDRFSVWETNDDERVKRFQDPSKNGVKILTLHVSKGLEFDVVFALGLVNRLGVKDDLIPVESNGKLFLTPLSKDRTQYQSYFEEIDAEKMRQLYVAMTRAKYRLYIPVALHISSSQIDLGDASPMDLFLSRLGQPFSNYEELYQLIKQNDVTSLMRFLDDVGSQHHITYSIYEEIETLSKIQFKNEKIALNAPKHVNVPGKAKFINSFTSLAHPHQPSIIMNPPHDFDSENKNVHTLPSSQETGILIHSILEKVRFTDFYALDHPEKAISSIRPYIYNSMFKGWEETICSLIFNTLKTPLENSFCLADIPMHQIYREMPFMYSSKGGFTKGVIDLAFLYKDKYYIVDWKTNWLGHHENDYHLARLQTAMIENQYDLQAQIYTEAFKRYLNLVESDSFENCFGGVFYLFVRGMKPGFKTGIYHHL